MEKTLKSDKCARKPRKSRDAEQPSTKDQDETTENVEWKYLEHAGPAFEPPYKLLPKEVEFKYDEKVVQLSPKAEEVAVFYAMKLEGYEGEDKETIKKTFFDDWRTNDWMEDTDLDLIRDLSKCDFKEIKAYLERKKNKDEIEREKQQKVEIEKKYGYCIVDGHKVKMKKYKVENSGIHWGNSAAKGKLKKRIQPEDVTINCSKGKEPEPPYGKWKEVKNDNKNAWVASWYDEVANKIKQIRFEKNERDKYETARELHKHIGTIREKYRYDWTADDLESRQRGVALYFLDTLALRVGSDENASTTACCTLRANHVKMCGNNEIQLEFIGKCNIPYKNKVLVEEQVYKNLEQFIKNAKLKDGNSPPLDQPEESPVDNLASSLQSMKLNKDTPSSDQATFEEEPVNNDLNISNQSVAVEDNGTGFLFDKINSIKLNKYLYDLDLMPKLTAKVFRTYRACATLEQYLEKFTTEAGDAVEDKIAAFHRANMEVAKLCNHKNPAKSRSSLNKSNSDDNEDYRTLSSKEDYIDPRIVIAWCKRNNVPIENIYRRGILTTFQWAIVENDLNFVFCKND